MTDPQAVTLIGYRACGKSSVGPLLAEALGWTWQDSDAVVEQRAGMSVRRIFELEGESGFRRREADVLDQLLNQRGVVISAGGGAVLNEMSRRRMRAAGPVVWLQAPAAVLAARIAADLRSGELRPGLTGRPADQEVAEVLVAREPLYRDAATLTVDAGVHSVEETAEIILETLRPLVAGSHLE